MQRMVLVGLAVVISMAATAASGVASACGNGTERRLNLLVAAIAKAERDVSEGRPRLAAQAVLNGYPRIRGQVIGRNPVADRALRVMARAVVRTGGAIDARRRFPGATDEERRKNARWARQVLRGFVNRNPKDAAARTDYAEALARMPERGAEAERLLSALAKQDLVSSAQGYAALAKLRRKVDLDKPSFIVAPARAVKEARARLADVRCRRMAIDEEVVCAGKRDTGPKS